MTRKEAIEILRYLPINIGRQPGKHLIQEAMNMAIEALERKHGEWIEDGYQGYTCVCSICGTAQEIKAKFLFSFCPNCGARMVSI